MKIKPIAASPTAIQQYVFRCPACDDMHAFNASWCYNGDGDNPTVAPSLLVTNGDPSYRCHSYITAGRIQFLSDSSHEFAGQTLDLPDVS